jgi:hypothetical protein
MPVSRFVDSRKPLSDVLILGFALSGLGIYIFTWVSTSPRPGLIVMMASTVSTAGFFIVKGSLPPAAARTILVFPAKGRALTLGPR